MSFFHGKVQLKEQKNCFITLPAQWKNVNARPNSYNLIVMKIIFLDDLKCDKFIYVTWNGQRNSTNDYFNLDRSFALKSNIQDNESILVQVIDDINRLPSCVSCYLKPLSEDDFQLILLNSEELEFELLNQLRIVTCAFFKDNLFNIFPLWLKSSPNVPIFVKICKVEPGHKTGLLITKDTKITILNLNDSIPDSNNDRSPTSNLRSMFDLVRKLIPSTETVLPPAIANVQEVSTSIQTDQTSKSEYVSVPIYPGRPLILRIILDNSIEDRKNNFISTAFISNIHFENLKNYDKNFKGNYCLVKLNIIDHEFNQKVIEPLNFDMSSMSFEEKFCNQFMEKFFKSVEHQSESYLLVMASKHCPSNSIIVNRELIEQRSLPFLSHVCLTGFDPQQTTSLSAKSIKGVNYLQLPIVKQVTFIPLKLFDPKSNNPSLEFEKELKQNIPDKESKQFEHLLFWNGSIVKYGDCKYISLSNHFAQANLDLDVTRLMAMCFIINVKTNVTIQQVSNGLNGLMVNYLNQLTKTNQLIDQLCMNHNDSVLLKPFAGRDDILKKCLHFINHSLNLSEQCESSSLFSTMLITGAKGSGKTMLIERILYDCSKNHSVWSHKVNCSTIKGKRIESMQKLFTKLFNEAVQHQPSILVFEDLHQLSPETNDERQSSDLVESSKQTSPESFYYERVAFIFCQLIDTLRRLKSSGSSFARVCIVISSESLSKLNMLIQKSNVFDRIIEIRPLGTKRMMKVIKEIFDKKDYSLPNSESEKINPVLNIDMECLSKMTKKFNAQQLNILIDMIIHGALVDALKNCQQGPNGLFTLNINDEHVHQALRKFNSHGSSLSASNSKFKMNTKRFLDDVGGMNNVKEIINDMILVQIRHPRLHRQLPLKLPNSLLLYGMPGTGKTFIVEAIANETRLNFISVKGPELLSKYIGNSEKSVRNVFGQAQELAPCILFFDEFDSLAPKRGHDSTGVTDRVVNQMLTLLDGLEERKQNIFIIAATSRPDLIDLALLRPGRFDQTVYCQMPNQDERKEILLALAKKLPINCGHREEDNNNIIDSTTIPFNQLVKSTENFSGADLQALLYNAFLDATKQYIERHNAIASGQVTSTTNVNQEQFNNNNNNDTSTSTKKMNIGEISINWQNIQQALLITKPSLSEHERNRFIRIYKKFEAELSGRMSVANVDRNDSNNKVVTLA